MLIPLTIAAWVASHCRSKPKPLWMFTKSGLNEFRISKAFTTAPALEPAFTKTGFLPLSSSTSLWNPNV